MIFTDHDQWNVFGENNILTNPSPGLDTDINKTMCLPNGQNPLKSAVYKICECTCMVSKTSVTGWESVESTIPTFYRVTVFEI